MPPYLIQMIVVYVSSRCSNCTRVLGLVSKIPSLQGARVVNVDVHPVQSVEYVPTIVDDTGRSHVGSAALEYLKQFNGEIELESVSLGAGLAYGSIDDGSLDQSGFGWSLS
jgi:hypothetical protein